MNIQIHAKNLKLTPEMKNYLEKKIGCLYKLLDNILETKAEIGKMTEHHRQGKIFYVEVNMTLPGRLIRSVVEKDNLWLAIDEVKDELQREINKYRGKRKAEFKKGSRLFKDLKSIDPSALIKKIGFKGKKEKK